jgi:precorrin-6B methylase 2
MEQKNSPAHSPEAIMQVGLGFWPSKILLTAVKLDLFTVLAESKRSGAAELKSKLDIGCSDRHWFDFLDTLTALSFLVREGLLETAKYSNHSNTDFFLDRNKTTYIGGILIMANNRLYRFWGELETALKTGEPQNEVKFEGVNLFQKLYESPEVLREFVHAMSGIQMGNFMQFAQKFDFSAYKTLVDIGGAGAMLSIMVAKHQPHMHCINFDLPQVEPIAKENINKFNLADRIETRNGDFFKDDFPKADVIVMGNILHDWNEKYKLLLIRKSYEALHENGAFVVIENIIDDNRMHNVFGLMMSINMLIETGEGFDYTFADFTKWTTETGFKRTELIPLMGPASAAIAYK